jgi:hypothetical protein
VDDADLLDHLARWAGEARAEEAAADRAQQRMLEQMAAEEATFSGVCLDLAERDAQVVVRTLAGRTHRGRILTVGRDFLVVREAGGPPVLLAMAAVASVRLGPGERAGTAPSGREGALDSGLAAVLAGVAPERPRVQVMAVGDPQPVTGELRTGGRDVAGVRLDGDRPGTVYLRVSSIAELTLLDL